MYELDFDDRVANIIEKLPKEISKRILNKLEKTKENPHRYFEKLVGLDEYKLRVGDYRIIADIYDNKLIILVLYVNHRSKVYGRF